VEAEFPKGWTTRPTNHYMWSDLLDDKGRVRGTIFYKPDFWDQDAHVKLNRRYYARTKRDYEWLDANRDKYTDMHDVRQDQPVTVTIIDTANWDKPVWSYGPITAKGYATPWPEFDNALNKLSDEAIQTQFPNHEDVLAYWD
jgi:hypothetical protein